MAPQVTAYMAYMAYAKPWLCVCYLEQMFLCKWELAKEKKSYGCLGFLWL